MKRFFLKYCRTYRRLIDKLYGKYNVERLSIPFDIYENFNYCYVGFDKNGTVRKGFCGLVEAIKNRGDLGLTVLYDKY